MGGLFTDLTPFIGPQCMRNATSTKRSVFSIYSAVFVPFLPLICLLIGTEFDRPDW